MFHAALSHIACVTQAHIQQATLQEAAPIRRKWNYLVHLDSRQHALLIETFYKAFAIMGKLLQSLLEQNHSGNAVPNRSSVKVLSVVPSMFLQTKPTGSLLSQAQSRIRASATHTSVLEIPAFSRRLPMVPVLSSEASSPFPFAVSCAAVLTRSCMSEPFDDGDVAATIAHLQVQCSTSAIQIACAADSLTLML